MPNAVCSSIRPSPVRTRSAAASLRVEASLGHDEVDARLEGQAGEPVGETQQPEADATRGARAGRVALASAARRLEGIGEAQRAADRGRPRPPGSRPSGARTSRPRRRSPRSGLVTSHAMRRRVSASRGSSAARSTVDRSSETVAPSARSRPAPPSVVALPPIPSAIVADPGVEHRAEDIARAGARGGMRVPLVRGHEAEAGGLGHLHEGRAGHRAREPAGTDRAAERVVRLGVAPASSRRTPRPRRACPRRRRRVARGR